MCEGWSCDAGSRGASDDAMTVLSLNILPPHFTPKRVQNKTNWDVFEDHIRCLLTPSDAWSTSESTLQMTDILNSQIQAAIEGAVPCTRPSKLSRRWWTQALSQQKEELAAIKRLARSTASSDNQREKVRNATRAWTLALRKAQWKHWEETLEHADRRNFCIILGVSSRKKEVAGLPKIKDASSFQRTCEILRDSFFPNNVATPPATGRLAPPSLQRHE